MPLYSKYNKELHFMITLFIFLEAQLPRAITQALQKHQFTGLPFCVIKLRTQAPHPHEKVNL
jgi:hypothetical protein